jgi:RHS repeat-associated protein
MLTDINGDKVQGYLFTPYGEEWITEDAETSVTNEITRKFTGQEFDKESGLYYYNARYYDPKAGIFITPDPAMDGLNHYAYCSANPITYVDPTGLEGWGGPSGWGGPTGAGLGSMSDSSKSGNMTASQNAAARANSMNAAGVGYDGRFGYNFAYVNGIAVAIGQENEQFHFMTIDEMIMKNLLDGQEKTSLFAMNFVGKFGFDINKIGINNQKNYLNVLLNPKVSKEEYTKEFIYGKNISLDITKMAYTNYLNMISNENKHNIVWDNVAIGVIEITVVILTICLIAASNPALATSLAISIGIGMPFMFADGVSRITTGLAGYDIFNPLDPIDHIRSIIKGTWASDMQPYANGLSDFEDAVNKVKK